MFERFRQFDNVPNLPWVKQDHWDLNQALLKIKSKYGTEALSLGDSFRGFQIFGSTGSGKTSGSGKAVAEAFLKSGYGGLVLVVKNDEVENWRKYAKTCGRSDDLIVVEPDGKYSFNFLDSSNENPDSEINVMNIVQMIIDISLIYNREAGGKSQDSFWSDQLQTVLTKAIVLSRNHDGKLSTAGIVKAFKCAVDHSSYYPVAKATGTKTKFESTYGKDLVSACHEYREAYSFFFEDFKNLAEKTRSIIVAMFGSLVEPLCQYPLKNVFGDLSSVRPSDAFQGKIIVVNIPIHEYRKAGTLCQLIWKINFMNAVTGRVDAERPVFLWADESQYFIEKRDIQFMTTARSKRCSVVYLTQNISNYDSILTSQAETAAIVGSLNNRIYHQNNDPKTNEWASNSIGKIKIKRTSTTTHKSGSESKTVNEQHEHEVQERYFTSLKSGGKENQFSVEAVVHVPGKTFSNGRSCFKATFSQLNREA
jgi:hypothetical protein